ncbi:MAG: ABC transporter permease, partial [Anaerolineae bacterium]|nr:ABC transporter permease [Anaerolineae bacterium]
MKKAFDNSLPVLVIVSVFVVWEIAGLIFRIDEFILPRPTVIFAALLKWQSAIWPNAWQTLFTTLIGFGLAIIAGLILGLLIGYFKWIYNALYPLLIGFNSIPKAALVPVLVIWFGIGTIPA